MSCPPDEVYFMEKVSRRILQNPIQCSTICWRARNSCTRSDGCGHPNPVNLDSCQKCGEKFGHDFVITLDNALRMGGIAREMDVDEADVQEAEKYYKNIRKEILESGDARVIEVLSLFPDEALVKLKRILDKAGK